MTTTSPSRMAVNATPGRWATASLSGAPDTSPGELHALGDHAASCRGARGPLFRAQCIAEAVFGFFAPRLVTTAVVVALVFGVGSLVA